ncbi:hypothetical protein ACFFLM_19270 [Deinococcus oregonensis]|uniref:Uncharacterized protein n=1 Tax=Deinococcus oregonensis TaxID=1805970 RepID=A0ABV6B6T6_9DEIO
MKRTDLPFWVPLPPHMWSSVRFRLEVCGLIELDKLEEARALTAAYAPALSPVPKERVA